MTNAPPRRVIIQIPTGPMQFICGILPTYQLMGTVVSRELGMLNLMGDGAGVGYWGSDISWNAPPHDGFAWSGDSGGMGGKSGV